MTSIDQVVRDRIEQALTDLERDKHISILLAVSNGSHSWGAAGPESDYDVQFVYKQSYNPNYELLKEVPDTIEETVDTWHIELSGWSLSKFLSLLQDSNNNAIDVLRSPIQYRQGTGIPDLRRHVLHEFNPIHTYHAYRGMAANNYRKYIKEHVTDSDGQAYEVISEADNGELHVRPTDEVDSKHDRVVDLSSDNWTRNDIEHTPKRCLTTIHPAMYARYLGYCVRNGAPELPALDFEEFLDRQAPELFDEENIEYARTLLEKKRNGERLGETKPPCPQFALPDPDVDSDLFDQGGPSTKRLNDTGRELFELPNRTI